MCGFRSGSFSKILVKLTLDYPLPAQAIAPFLGCTGKRRAALETCGPALAHEAGSKIQGRVAKDVKFAEIIKNNKEAADKKGIIRLADLRKEMEKENGGTKKETPAEIKKKARDQYAPFINESVNVLLDMVMLGSVPRI